ncbi:MAG TPA: hypothetical protein VFO62_10665 [Candidatus Binatia bacterium]|nr:hypothetical protein [Candidatus Binatia bacterium]
MESLQLTPYLRAATVCLACGCDPDGVSRRCDSHGDEVTTAIVPAPAYVFGVTSAPAPALGTAADLERLGLVAS